MRVISILVVISNTVWCGGHAYSAKPLVYILHTTRSIRVVLLCLCVLLHFRGVCLHARREG